MSSMFDYDDSINLAFDAKIAGKSLVAAKHELLTKTGEFLFLAHSDRELALRMQMIEEDIEKVAYRKLSNISDSKAKLVRAIFDEWDLRHASCEMCKVAHEEDRCVECNRKLKTGTAITGGGLNHCRDCYVKMTDNHETPKHWGQIEASKEAHAGVKDTNCDECGAKLTAGARADDVRGHLDICSKHLK